MGDTVSSKSLHDDNVTTTLGQEHVSQDINADESLSASMATFNHMAQLNLKRTYDVHQSIDLDGIHNARRLQNTEAEMRIRHAEDLHKQALRHAESEHVIKLQTMQAGSVGTSSIVRDIATDTADQIVTMAKAKLGT